MNISTSISILTTAEGAATTSTCASAEKSAESDSDGRIGPEEYRTASALKNVRRLRKSALMILNSAVGFHIKMLSAAFGGAFACIWFNCGVVRFSHTRTL